MVRMSLLSAASALALCVSTAGAGAEPLQFYVTVENGMFLITDSDVSAGGVSGDIDVGPGFLTGLGAGIVLGSGIHAGVDVLYSGFDPKDITIPGVGGVELSGDASAVGAFGSVGYEYKGWAQGDFRPFVDVGAGMMRVGVSDVRATGFAGQADDSDWVFAARAGAGFFVKVLDNWDFLMSYHYLYADDADLDFTAGGVTTPVSLDFSGHMASAGLRYRF